MSRKTVFSRVVDAIVEGRMLQAKRIVDEYQRRNPSEPPRLG